MRYKKIEGEKVYFSPIDSKDYETFTQWINDETLSRGIGSACKCFSEAIEKSYLENAEKNGNYQFSVIRKVDEKLIGSYGVVKLNQLHQNCEVGGFIGDVQDRGQGYGTETLRIMCDYCFNVLNMRNITYRVFGFNIASIKSAQKVGFEQAGRLSEAYYYNNAFHDEFIFQINKQTFNMKWKSFIKPF